MSVAVLMAILLVPAVTFAQTEPSTTDQGDGAVSVEPSTTDQGDGAVSVDESSAPSTPSESSRGGSSSGSKRSKNVYPVATATVINSVVSTNTSCPLIKSYIKFGNKNDVAEVTKLQNFLKTEGINVDVNGTFDQKTFDGVKAFQAKYVVDTMGPWGSKTPTGNVFVTTKNKINEIACNTKIALTAEQLASINAYKANLNTTNTVSTTTIEIGATEDTSNTATVVNTSIWGKTKGFVKWLFGY